MRATHFGAGNIGRGFIGEILASNDFSIDFVDINETIINSLHENRVYDIELADASKKRIHVENVDGINNKDNPEAVIDSVFKADIVTTAIGPTILPFIAELIAKGIQKRRKETIETPLDVIACENMIGGSQFLFSKVKEFLDAEDLAYVEKYIGFPNAAVDRIVPIQHHEDPLFVSVEPFSEWVIDETQIKNKAVHLAGVEYVEDLEPYIERKLFSVNTGHATVAYVGAYKNYKTIGESIEDPEVLAKLRAVLGETGSLLINKWGFDPVDHQAYINKIVGRFENPYISDGVDRVARTPIRKLGYDERFIRPIRELKDRNLTYTNLMDVVAMILSYNDPADTESVKLQNLLKEKDVVEVVKEVTGLTDNELITEIANSYQK
ncbi:mannitol-1-phosphate 5-dehydrogenase [Enterococcus sp. AZ126]|uniref:mannitol-1-phosphate 5-dehydrogenase n=1 Tax=Enterococcus sp. AZ126 TaxID=2774635 RepID=UPI003F1EFDEA